MEGFGRCVSRDGECSRGKAMRADTWGRISKERCGEVFFYGECPENTACSINDVAMGRQKERICYVRGWRTVEAALHCHVRYVA